MANRTVPITSTPVKVVSKFEGSVQIAVPVGQPTVYVSHDTNVNPATSIALPGGASYTASGDSDIFAATASPNVSQLSLQGNGDSLNLASVTVGGLSDTLLVYDPPSGQIPVGDTVIFPQQDVSSYSTIVIQCGDVNSAGIGNTGAISRLTLQWYTHDGKTIAKDAPYYFSEGILNFNIPVKGPLLSVTVTAVSVPSIALPIVILGLSDLLPRSYYSEPASLSRYGNVTVNDSDTDILAKAIGFYVNSLAGSTGTLFIPSFAGIAATQRRIVGSVTGSGLRYLSRSSVPPTGGGGIISQLSSDVATIDNNRLLVFPEKPMTVQLDPTASPQGYIFSIAWDNK